MEIGIAFDLRSDFKPDKDGPEDRLEDYDSESTIAAIAAVLESDGHHPRCLGGGRRFLTEVLERPPHLVFNLAEGTGSRSREAHVPAVCEMLGIPFTHSDPLTLAVSLDKGAAKRLVASFGVRTPRFAVVNAPQEDLTVPLAFPVIAKPLYEGSSMGVRKSSKIRSREELAVRTFALRRDYRQPVLVEEFLDGPEFTVGVWGYGATAQVFGIMEIAPRESTPQDFIYSLEVKRNWKEEVEYHVPPARPPAFLEAIARLGLDAYRALQCRDLARVDVRCDSRGEPHFLEVNPLPGINPETGDIVILAGRLGVCYRDLILGVVDRARARYGI